MLPGMNDVEQEPDAGPKTLTALEARLRRDLELLSQPARDWIRPRTHPQHGAMLDVAIVGAGMAGLTAAFALMRLGVRNIRLFDKAETDAEGPWVTYARMETLRSPKHLAGPALGLPNLTFRAWFEAQFGRDAWDRLGKIPRTQWMDYLRWYRRVLRIPIENGSALVDLAGDGDSILLTLDGNTGRTHTAARRVVLATGRDGLGGPYTPPMFRGLPGHLCTHSGEAIDFGGLAGKQVAVIGAGASAVDNAAEALEAGAAGVALLVRRPDIPRINKGMGVSNPGLALGFVDLPPERKWAINAYVADCQTPPPRDTMLRASRHASFSVHTACPILGVRMEADRIVLTTRLGETAFDFVILGTGFAVDWVRRPELARLARGIALWRDRYAHPDAPDHEFAEHPYLGPWFEFTERAPGAAPWVARVHCFNYASTMSHYKLTGDIPAISDGAVRLAEGIVRSIFGEDYADHYQRLLDYAQPELLGDEWRQE
jgi:cation diffusion facilitator CzcD-associated flavoprotein CzcO